MASLARNMSSSSLVDGSMGPWRDLLSSSRLENSHDTHVQSLTDLLSGRLATQQVHQAFCEAGVCARNSASMTSRRMARRLGKRFDELRSAFLRALLHVRRAMSKSSIASIV